MNKKILANIFLFLTAIIWGFAFVAQVLGSDVIDPFSFNAIRFGLGALSLVPVIFLLEKRPRSPLTAEQRSDDNKKLKMTLIAAAVCGTILFVASTLQQVGAQALCPFERLLEFPFTDLGLVAGQQDVGNLPALVVSRARIDGRGQ